jgi:hypothetical protein
MRSLSWDRGYWPYADAYCGQTRTLDLCSWKAHTNLCCSRHWMPAILMETEAYTDLPNPGRLTSHRYSVSCNRCPILAIGVETKPRIRQIRRDTLFTLFDKYAASTCRRIADSIIDRSMAFLNLSQAVSGKCGRMMLLLSHILPRTRVRWTCTRANASAFAR